MSYRLKGQKVILDADKVYLTPKALPSSPLDGCMAVDIVDKKLKIFNESLNRWIVLGDAIDIVFDNSSNGFNATNIQAAIEESKSSIQGSLFSVNFSNNGTSSNLWLNLAESPIPSNAAPYVVPFDCKFVGMTFTNASNNIDQNIEIYISNQGDGSIAAKTFIYALRNVRTYCKTDLNTNNNNLNLSAGDKVSVYLRDMGDNANDPVVTLFFKTRNDNDHTNSENHSNNFSLTLGPITIILG